LKEEAANYNATTGDALARPTGSGCMAVQVFNLDKGVVSQRQLRAFYSVVLFTSNRKFTQRTFFAITI
jgi:hypothetical protein